MKALLEGDAKGSPGAGNGAPPPLLWDKGVWDGEPQASGGKRLQCPKVKGRWHALSGTSDPWPVRQVSGQPGPPHNPALFSQLYVTGGKKI